MSTQQLREVEQFMWKLEPEVDHTGTNIYIYIYIGKKKVFQIEGYPGQYKDSKGKLYDLRPIENAPTKSNLIKLVYIPIIIIIIIYIYRNTKN